MISKYTVASVHQLFNFPNDLVCQNHQSLFLCLEAVEQLLSVLSSDMMMATALSGLRAFPIICFVDVHLG